MKYYSVTFSHKYEGAADYTPRTAVFSTRERAEEFMAIVMGMHDERDQDYLVATIDSGFIDSEEYLEWFTCEMVDCKSCRWYGGGAKGVCTICKHHDLWELPDFDEISDCCRADSR